MTKYTISDAAQLYKKSRATLYKDIKNGNLSRDYSGMIDFSELLRVYGEPISKTQSKRMKMYKDNTHNTSEYTVKNTDTTIRELQKQIDFLTKQLEKAETREAQANTRIDTLLTLIELKTPYTPNQEKLEEKQSTDSIEKVNQKESQPIDTKPSNEPVVEPKTGLFNRVLQRIKL